MEYPEAPMQGDRRQLVDIVYPDQGLSENYSYTDQMPQTSRDERNMRSFDIVTGRRRGSQRPGLGLWSSKTPLNGFYKVDLLATVQRGINPYKWTQQDPVKESDIDLDLSDGAYIVDAYTDSFGTVWLLNNNGEVIAVNEDGEQLESVGVPYVKTGTNDTTFLLKALAVDDFGNIFVATGHVSGNDNNEEAQIVCMELRPDGTYKVAWTIKPGFFPLDIEIYGLDLFVFGVHHHDSYGSVEVRFARYAEYRMDEEPDATAASAYTQNYNTLTGAYSSGWSKNHFWYGRMAVRKDGVCYCTMSAHDSSNALHSAHILRLHPLGSNAAVAAFEYGYADTDEWTAADRDRQGYGLEVLVHPEKINGRWHIWTIGGQHDGSAGTFAAQPHIRLIGDDGDGLDWANSSDIAFGTANNATIGWHLGAAQGRTNIVAGVDKNGYLYVPYGITAAQDPNSQYADKSVLVIDKDGSSVVYQYTQAQLGRASSVQQVVAVPFAQPDYNESSPLPVTVDTMIVGGQHATGPPDNAAVQVRLVRYEVPTFQPVREMRQIALSGGKWYKYDDTTVTEISGATYDRSTRYQHATVYDGEIYVADGQEIQVYSAADDTVRELRAKSFGAVPHRARLIEQWRGRMVAARTDEAPGIWRMSRMGDWEDWDEFPTVPDAAAAVTSQTSRAGVCPDAINTIVPYSDDVLWFGCDNSIWQLSGDPGAQHVFDNINDEIGMAYGKPWCRDDVGRLWFFGSKGGLYTMEQGSLRDIAGDRIRQRLRKVDLSKYFVRLAYNYEEDGIHIFLCPFDNPQIPVDHYFYCKRTGSFHVDHFGTDSVFINPTAVQVVDGDAPADRCIHIGCEDGRIRRWGKSDNGTVPYSDEVNASPAALNPLAAIDSYVLIGPLAPVRDTSEAAFSDFTAILSSKFDGCNYEFFASDDPEHLGRAVAQGTLSGGRNATELVRVSGDSVFLRLRNNSKDSYWSLEKASIYAAYAGMIRPV